MAYMYYIDYKSKNNFHWYKKLYNRIFFNYEIVNFDTNKKIVLINKKYLNKRACKKLNKILRETGNAKDSCTIISNDIKLKYNLKNNFVANRKNTMKCMILNILTCIEQYMGADFRNEDIYVSLCEEIDVNFILDIAERFKSVNIVTNKIKKIRRLTKKLEDNYDLNIAVSNNKRKSLKKSKLLVNVGFDTETMEEFSLNRNCTIVNLSNNKLNLKNSFHGVIVESIELGYNNRYKSVINERNYNKQDLYESFIYDLSYNEAKRRAIEDCCYIKSFIGNNNYIIANEFRNNFTKSSIKLDKIQKKD